MAKKKVKKKTTKKKAVKKKLAVKKGAPENKKMKFEHVDNCVDPVDIPKEEDMQEEFKYEDKSTLQTEGL